MSGSDDRLTPSAATRRRPGDRWADEVAAATSTAGRAARGATWAVVAVVTALVVAVGGTAFAAWRLNANITKLDVSAAIGTDRPTQAPEAAEAVNILLIGSDTREGAGNDTYADRDGTHGRRGALRHQPARAPVGRPVRRPRVVSIPRDSMTPAPPNCSATAPKDEWQHAAVEPELHASGAPAA